MSIDLVIMAGGMSSRFGRYKQLEPVDDYGNTLIDLTILDAVTNNFKNVIIITRQELLRSFELKFKKQYGDILNVILAIQSNLELPQNKALDTERIRPWGTAHALWTGMKYVENDFLLMNADDYYDSDTIARMVASLRQDTTDVHYMAAYKLSNTIMDRTQNVNRGICDIQGSEVLSINVIERIKREGNIFGGRLDRRNQALNGDEITCMNLYGFRKSLIFPLEKHILDELQTIDICEGEISIHDMVNKEISKGDISLKTVVTDGKCYGLTQIEDLAMLRNFIKNTKDES